jgi:protein gp37
VEPLLEPIDFGDSLEGIDWLITGGESGHKARPMNVDWVLDIHEQGRKYNVAIFHKQMGELWSKEQGIHAEDSKGGNMDYWPEALRVREQPKVEVYGVNA